MMRVLFGGSFDPVHHGHLAVAKYLRDSGARVTMIVSGDPPFRSAPVACASDRMDMLRLALEGEEGIEASESRSIVRSPYTIDVVRRVRERFGDEASLGWALGSDQFAQLDTWREWRKLIEHIHLIVLDRIGNECCSEGEVAAHLEDRRANLSELFNAPFGLFARVSPALPNISSTQVRERLSEKSEVASLLPDKVLAHIRRRGHYGAVRHSN